MIEEGGYELRSIQDGELNKKKQLQHLLAAQEVLKCNSFNKPHLSEGDDV